MANKDILLIGGAVAAVFLLTRQGKQIPVVGGGGGVNLGGFTFGGGQPLNISFAESAPVAPAGQILPPINEFFGLGLDDIRARLGIGGPAIPEIPAIPIPAIPTVTIPPVAPVLPKAEQAKKGGGHLGVFEHLGAAPYKYVGHESTEDRGNVQAARANRGLSYTTNLGTSCDHCATAITDAFWFTSADGKKFKVGSECAKKAFAAEKSTKAQRDFESARLAIARDKLTAFRQKYGELDPLQGAQMTSGIVGSIAQQLTTDRVKLEGMLSYFKPDSPQVMTQKAVIGALERELELQRETLTGAGDGSTYTKLLTEYQNLSIEEEFAVNAYTSALSFLKLSRNEAQRQQSYVSAFMPPTLPEKASFPNVPKEILVVLIGALLMYTVLALIITTIREQARL